MCCAVQTSHVEKFVNKYQEDTDFEAYPILLKQLDLQMANKKSRISTYSKTEKPGLKLTTTKLNNGAKTDGDTATETSTSEGEAGKKKKKKWRKVPLSDTSFNLSLFPRPTKPDKDPEEEERLFNKIEAELENFEALLDKCSDFHTSDNTVFDGHVSKCDKLARRDRDRRVQKAGKQVKHKYCSSLKNNDGRKKLFIHHRLYKLMHLAQQRIHFLPSPKARYNVDINKIKNENNSSSSSSRRPERKPAPVQNLRHTLHETNAPTDIDASLVDILISLQHRELTPEDYGLLCQLDESVAPKTIDKSFLESFKTDTVTSDTAEDLCPVCMDQYQVGQNRKFLPCSHVFHTSCIDMWLENSSRNCPIDGLPVDGNS